MHPFLAQVLAKGPVITDGAWGTQLQARGLAQGAAPDAWNLTYPERVEEVPRAYLAAGSQIVLTNTFQANRLTLAGHGLDGQLAQINTAGVEISLRAALGKAHVFASIGPTGKMLFMGQTTAEELTQVYAEQAACLAAAGAEGLVIETMSDLEEAKLALAAAKTTGLPVVVCMVFDSGKDFDRTMMGTTVEQAARELEAAGADALGANCGQGPAGYVAIGRRLRAATTLPLWLKPNAGLPQFQDGQVFYSTTPLEFADAATRLLADGASFLGGCCGTGPEFIRAVVERVAR
jgi:methionine synthase I (cobalamin-dependent)